MRKKKKEEGAPGVDFSFHSACSYMCEIIGDWKVKVIVVRFFFFFLPELFSPIFPWLLYNFMIDLFSCYWNPFTCLELLWRFIRVQLCVLMTSPRMYIRDCLTGYLVHICMHCCTWDTVQSISSNVVRLLASCRGSGRNLSNNLHKVSEYMSWPGV